ncbi:hypothetical protein DAI22_05g067400 [Oryza sativa Japonica Group]|nr:hypothetical protein DAI22_05g067400 [Oryza sativa Japonica Group]
MARSRRRCIVQSHEEYLSEEHIAEENAPKQLATPSEQETICSDVQEGNEDTNDDVGEANEDTDDDASMNAGEGNEESDDDVEINVRDENGTIETRGKTKLKDIWNLPKRLRIVVQCNDLNQAVGDEAGILSKFLGMMRFLYAPRMEEFILKTIRERWRGHKAKLKEKYFDVNKSKEANCNNVPADVLPDQWIALINHWMSEKSKRQKDPAKNPHRAIVYIQTHKRKTGKNLNGHVDNLKKLVVEQPALADTSEGRTAWKGDALNQILGDDKPGHNINVTRLDDNWSEDVVAARLQLEKIENHVQNHDAELLELKAKTNKLEKEQMNQGGLDRVSTNKEASVDGPISKRRRVYSDHPLQEICIAEEENDMVQEENNMMNIQSHVPNEDLQPKTKQCVEDKNKQNWEQHDYGKQRKVISAQKRQCSTTNFIADNSMEDTNIHVQNKVLQLPTKQSTIYKSNQTYGQNHLEKQRKIICVKASLHFFIDWNSQCLIIKITRLL